MRAKLTATREQHGAHLPLNHDILVSEYLAGQLAKHEGLLVAPTLNYGVNLPCDMTFAGSASITPRILKEMLVSITTWWNAQGFEEFILLSYHGDPFHEQALEELGAGIYLLTPHEIDYLDILEKQETIRHACEAETSVALYLHPEKVRMNEIKEHDIVFSEFKPYLYHEKTDKPKGYVGALGYPSAATAEKGEKIVVRMIEKLLAEYKAICRK